MSQKFMFLISTMWITFVQTLSYSKFDISFILVCTSTYTCTLSILEFWPHVPELAFLKTHLLAAKA